MQLLIGQNLWFTWLAKQMISQSKIVLLSNVEKYFRIRAKLFWRMLVKYEAITRGQILDSSKLREFADDNFRFDENGRKLSEWVENTVGKGEIACCKQFLLFPQCFQKACFRGVSKGVIVWEWVNSYAPASIDQGHILFGLSVCQNFFLHWPYLVIGKS